MNPHYWEIRRRRRGRVVRRTCFCIIVAGPPLRWNCPSVVSIKRWNIKRFPLAPMLPRWKLTAAWLIGCSFKYLSWPRDHYFGVDVCSAAHPPFPSTFVILCRSPPTHSAINIAPLTLPTLEGTWINKFRFVKRSFFFKMILLKWK